ncbi:CDP-diacylglycerol--glycerol-3-phosphate 3-phosphatidyltransferase, mitochondrial-like [Macrosteles quadrilineatus]|uniref:CDP-diacylglycerol--glycerol-3-phosphate 3-phosphatidyltransferase, mitochondrial-like n=1 Tax=Macrosteles quadrilineatus TaxID=74068 RepID=UPI0023E0D785|nr:CDP-diacylglycerol--glycerol-3-phosphate 3-phosphatidyltransferase, mitochondrial-like [Macrosteles quadrilineatus]
MEGDPTMLGRPTQSNDLIHNSPIDLKYLQSEAISFSLQGDQVKVLFSPEEFYSAIIEGCQNAKHRITLAALYIGMNSMEKKLVEVLDDRLRERGSNLQLTVLLDAVRDSRDCSARIMLLPLLRKHSHCQVSLFQTPDLHWFWSKICPPKVNELIGIQHIKLYVFDDNVLITGANLTKEYFSNRQDRYVLVTDCQPIADFCCGLVDKICSVSLQLTEENTILQPSTFPAPGLYRKQARQLVWSFYLEELAKSDKQLKPGDDTWVFPLLQLPPMSILQDSSVTQTLLQSLSPEVTVHFSSPYFNLPEEYITLLLNKCKNAFRILIPHPTANDFYGARGVVGQIPFFYSAFSNTFLQQVKSAKQTERFEIEEFVRSESSFHSKGIWCTTSDDDDPFMTIVGSSNFNCRSVSRDLECQFVMVTSNRGLRKRLAEEKGRLYQHGVPFTQGIACCQQYKPGLWHYAFLWLFKSYF